MPSRRGGLDTKCSSVAYRFMPNVVSARDPEWCGSKMKCFVTSCTMVIVQRSIILLYTVNYLVAQITFSAVSEKKSKVKIISTY